MNRRIRSISISTSAESFHRYLKPGALARLRDSRITAKCHRTRTASSFHRFPSSSPPVPASPSSDRIQIDASPCFSGRMYGPRFPQRKKLVAASSSCYFVPPSPVAMETSGSAAVEVFGTDIAAH